MLKRGEGIRSVLAACLTRTYSKAATLVRHYCSFDGWADLWTMSVAPALLYV